MKFYYSCGNLWKCYIKPEKNKFVIWPDIHKRANISKSSISNNLWFSDLLRCTKWETYLQYSRHWHTQLFFGVLRAPSSPPKFQVLPLYFGPLGRLNIILSDWLFVEIPQWWKIRLLHVIIERKYNHYFT